jgi:hypothetical protein
MPAPLTASREIDGHDAMRGYRVAGGISGYRARTFGIVRSLISELGTIDQAIDVGAGDGWAAKTLMEEGLILQCRPVDILRRQEVVLEPLLYDGTTLPFEDRSMTLAYAIDAAHHAADPVRFVRELARVSRRWVVLKDHTYRSVIGAWMLRLLDEIGNRRFAIGSPGHYQAGDSWFAVLRGEGFVLRKIVHPARCHIGALGAATNRLQFVASFERQR